MEWIAKQMLRDVRKCVVPRQSRIQRTDGEPAILDFMGEVARSGFVERAIRSVEDMIRTHKLALEEKIGEVLKVDTAAMAWLVEPYERLRRKQLSGSMLEFGSPVMLKVIDKVSGCVMQERWVEGTWLGRAVRDLQKPPTVEDLRTST